MFNVVLKHCIFISNPYMCSTLNIWYYPTFEYLHTYANINAIDQHIRLMDIVLIFKPTPIFWYPFIVYTPMHSDIIV